MKLVCETSYDIKSYQAEGGLDQYIEGIFIQADIKNGNGRLYPLEVLDPVVEKYIQEKVLTGSAVGELDHPETPTVNLKAASHRIVSLEKVGKDFIGKALILDTRDGNQVKGLLKGGVRLAVSTRGLASVVVRDDVSVIQPDFILSTIDIVSDPSAPSAFVNGVLEGKEWVCESGVFLCREIDQIRETIKKTPKPLCQKTVLEGFQKFMNHLAKG